MGKCINSGFLIYKNNQAIWIMRQFAYHVVQKYAAGSAAGQVCVIYYVMRDWLWVTWEDSSCLCKFVEGVGVTNLSFCNQCFVLVEYMHIQGFPTIHTCAFMACLQYLSYVVPYSCLFCRICIAQEDCGILVLIYLICSLCLMSIDLPDCLTCFIICIAFQFIYPTWILISLFFR